MMWEINSLSKEIPCNSIQTIAGFKRSGKVWGEVFFSLWSGNVRGSQGNFCQKVRINPV